jgi:hypothetical protein
MAAKSKLTYKIYEVRGSGQWHWEVATAEGQVVERGRARSAIEARAEAVRRGLAGTQSSGIGSKHKSEGDSGAASSA